MSGPRVLYCIPDARRYTDRLSSVLAASNGCERLVVLTDDPRIVAAWDYARSDVYVAHFWRLAQVGVLPLRMVVLAVQAGWLIKRYRLNIVHDNFGFLVLLFCCRRLLTGIVFVESFYSLYKYRLRVVWRDVPLWRLLSWKGTVLMFYNAALQAALVRLADYIVLQGWGLAERLAEDYQINAAKLRVVENSIDESFWFPRYDRCGVTRGDTSLDLLYIGPLDRTRGLELLLAVVVRALDAGVSVNLTLVGGWVPFDRKVGLEKLADPRLTRHVRILSRVDREAVRRFMWTHDIFVYHTRNDASPRIVLEAMAAGIPVIASRHPGIECLDVKGEILRFSDYGDVEEVVKLVQLFGRNRSQWQERALRGAEEVRDRFGREAGGRRYARLYDDVLDRS